MRIRMILILLFGCSFFTQLNALDWKVSDKSDKPMESSSMQIGSQRATSAKPEEPETKETGEEKPEGTEIPGQIEPGRVVGEPGRPQQPIPMEHPAMTEEPTKPKINIADELKDVKPFEEEYKTKEETPAKTVPTKGPSAMERLLGAPAGKKTASIKQEREAADAAYNKALKDAKDKHPNLPDDKIAQLDEVTTAKNALDVATGKEAVTNLADDFKKLDAQEKFSINKSSNYKAKKEELTQAITKLTEDKIRQEEAIQAKLKAVSLDKNATNYKAKKQDIADTEARLTKLYEVKKIIDLKAEIKKGTTEVKTMKAELKGMTKGSPEYNDKKKELDDATTKLAEAEKEMPMSTKKKVMIGGAVVLGLGAIGGIIGGIMGSDSGTPAASGAPGAASGVSIPGASGTGSSGVLNVDTIDTSGAKSSGFSVSQ